MATCLPHLLAWSLTPLTSLITHVSHTLSRVSRPVSFRSTASILLLMPHPGGRRRTMSLSLDSMPAETQLHIFRLLLPDDLDQLRGEDLANVRLTCKAVHAAATEVFFERRIILLWKENGIYVESPSVKLLYSRPDLAALVKSVWVALAAAEPEWLSKKAAFDHFAEPTPTKTLELAYKSTYMWLYEKAEEEDDFFVYDDDELFDDCRAEEDFTPAQYEAIREYHD